ncbi:MAG: ABC transporter permease subunit [Candidatus Rifleibacteriota bacterium]
MKNSFRIGKQMLKGCLRAKSLSLIIFFLISLITFMSMLSSSDSAYKKALVVDSGLSLINIFGLFLVAFVILPVFPTEKEKRTLTATLSFNVSRSQYLWGLWLGASSALALNFLAMSVILLIGLKYLAVSIEFGIFRQLFLNFLELMVLGSFAITVSVYFSYVVSAMITAALYLVGHMTISFQQAMHDWEGTTVGRILDVVWSIIPNLSLFNLKDIVLKNQAIPATYELIALIYALAMIFIAIEMASYRLNRENLM